MSRYLSEEKVDTKFTRERDIKIKVTILFNIFRSPVLICLVKLCDTAKNMYILSGQMYD